MIKAGNAACASLAQQLLQQSLYTPHLAGWLTPIATHLSGWRTYSSLSVSTGRQRGHQASSNDQQQLLLGLQGPACHLQLQQRTQQLPAAIQWLLKSSNSALQQLLAAGGQPAPLHPPALLHNVQHQQACRYSTSPSSSHSEHHFEKPRNTRRAERYEEQREFVREERWQPQQGQQQHQQQQGVASKDRWQSQQKQQQQPQQKQQPTQHPRRQQHGERQLPPLNLNAPTVSQLTHLIMSVSSPKSLLELVVKHHQSLNRIHIIAALNRAAHLWRSTATPQAAPAAGQQQQQLDSSSSSSQTLVGRQQLQHLILQLSGPFSRVLPQCDCREISSGLWSYAWCGLQPPKELLSAVVAELSSWDKLANAEPKHLINLSWAAAKLGCRDRQLFAAVAAAAGQHTGQLKATQVAALAWSMARAGFRDERLLAGLSDRAKQLLEQQLQQQQEQQQQQLVNTQGKNTKQMQKQAPRNLQFSLSGLSNVAWALGVLGWPDAQVMAGVAAVASVPPMLYDMKPYEAVNLLKGFALAAGPRDPWSSSSSSSSWSDVQLQPVGEAATAEADTADKDNTSNDSSSRGSSGEAAAAAAGLGSKLEPAAWAIAAASLRRLDEADQGLLARMMWSLAVLHGQTGQQHHQLLDPTGAAAGSSGGRVVFEQLCAALLSQFSQKPVNAQSLTVAAWALALAQQSGLTPTPLHYTSPWGHLAAPETSSSSSSSEFGSDPPSQQLLVAVADATALLAQQGLLKPHQVADLAAAFERQQRIQLTGASGGSFLSLRSSTRSQIKSGQQLDSSSSSSGGSNMFVVAPAADQAAADTAQQAEETAAVAAGVVGEAGGTALDVAMSAAVSALAAAAQQLASAGEPLDVQVVSRMVASFCGLQVRDVSLYQDLLQHLTPEQLQAANNETLVGTVRAAVKLAAAQPQLLNPEALHHPLWEQLWGVCFKRWHSFSGEQRSRLQPAVRLLPAGVASNLPVVAQLKQELGVC